MQWLVLFLLILSSAGLILVRIRATVAFFAPVASKFCIKRYSMVVEWQIGTLLHELLILFNLCHLTQLSSVFENSPY